MMPTARQIGESVKYARYVAGLDRKELAQTADVSYDMVAKIEQGTKMPSAPLLSRLAVAMGTTSRDILGRATSH